MTLRCHFTVVLMLLLSSSAGARTIVLTDEDCERMAFIMEPAPRWGWGGYDVATATSSTSLLYLYNDRAFLICFPLDRVPKNQRIVKAELSFSTNLQTPGDQKIHLRRLLAAWGAGVTWKYRAQRPAKTEWAKPGARGAGSDRAVKDAVVARVLEMGEHTVNVTEDVELWYTGAAANHGWLVSVEDPDVYVVLLSPLWTGRGTWKLRITYEPE